MPYVLGVDLGNSRTAAATCPLDTSPWGDADTLRLGMRSDSMASTVYLAPDGSVVVGDAAERHIVTEPGNVTRGFLTRMGDDTPLVVGTESCTPQDLTAALVMWVVERAASVRGGPPDHVVITHPPGWGPHRRMLLHQALRQAGLAAVTLLPEPIAVGEGHITRNQIDAGSALAVYSLGATTFSASVVRRTDLSTFELVSHTDGTEQLGGAYFDDALLDHLRGRLGGALDDLDPADQRARLSMIRLREECAAAKQRLSVDAETVIRVQLPELRTQLPVTRAEFEQLVRPALENTVDTLLRTVRRGGAEQLDTVLLVGDSTRIPLVAELISAKLPDQVVAAAGQSITVAASAALAARRLVTGGAAGGNASPARKRDNGVLDVQPPPHTATERTAVVIAADQDDLDEDEEPPPRPAIEIMPPDLPERRSRLRLGSGTKPGVLGAVAVLMTSGGVWLAFALQGGGSERPAPGMGPHATPPAATSGQQAPVRATSGKPSESKRTNSGEKPSDSQASQDGQDKDGR